MKHTRAARMLRAKPTRITRLTVELEVDRLWLRVQLRAAQLGITQVELAARMGIKQCTLSNRLAQGSISADWWARLVKALATPGDAGPWWRQELPEVQHVTARKVLNAIRRKMR